MHASFSPINSRGKMFELETVNFVGINMHSLEQGWNRKILLAKINPDPDPSETSNL